MDFLSRLLNKTGDYDLPERITVTAHAGSNGTVDNTIPSIEAALESGAEIVEFDLNVDDNGELRLSHNAPAGTEPTFEEALVLVKQAEDIFINIDVKTTRNIDKMQEIIVKHGMLDRVFYTGINEGFVADVREKSPLVQYYLNCYADTAELGKKEYCDKMTDRVIELGGIGVNINYKGVTPQLAESCHEKGLLLSVWTVNDEENMKKFISMGADNITTEQPTFLKEVMGKGKNE